MATPLDDAKNAPETGKIKIPELELQAIESAKLPVNKDVKGLSKDPEILDTAQVGEYTVVTYKESGRMQVFDEKGEALAVGNLEDSMNLKNFMGGLTYLDASPIADPTRKSRDTRYVEELPPHIRAFAKQVIASTGRGSRVQNYELDGKEIKLKVNGKVTVTSQGNYMVIFDSQAAKDNGNAYVFIAYKIKDKDGNDLLPRNWEKILPSTSTTLPDELMDTLDLQVKLSSTESFVKVRDKHFVTSTDSAVFFTELNDVLARVSNSTDKISNVKNNICVSSTGIVYYCTSERTNKIHMVGNTTDAVNKWKPRELELPKTYLRVSKLSIDPTCKFLIANTNDGMVIWSTSKGKIIEIDKTPGQEFSHFDHKGRIVTLDSRKRLRTYKHNLESIQNSLEIAEMEDVDLSDKESASGKKIPREFEGLVEPKTRYEEMFKDPIDKADTLEKLGRLKPKVDELHAKLISGGGRTKAQADFIVSGVRESIAAKETILADIEVGDVVKKVRLKLQGGATINTFREAQEELDEVNKLLTAVSPAIRNEVRDISAEANTKATEIFKNEADKIETELESTLSNIRKQVAGLDSLSKYEDWRDLDFPHVIAKLGGYMRICPAECHDTAQRIINARKEVQKLADEAEKKLMEQHEQVREKSAVQLETRATIIMQDIHAFVDRLVHRKFKKREEAEDFVRRNPALVTIKEEIKAIGEKNTDKEKELDEKLEGALMNAYYQIELASQVVEAPDGREMVVFGKVLFPKYEAPVKKMGKRIVELTFAADEKTKGPGISAKDIYGDIAVTITNAKGEKETVRVFEDIKGEDDWRYGTFETRGKEINPSYVQQTDYVELRKRWADWSKGSNSKLRSEYEKLKKDLEDLYEGRPDPLTRKANRDAGMADADWEKGGAKYEEYKKLIETYANFCANNSIHILRRLDQIVNNPDEEVHENGKGIVPEWSPHWVVAPEDERMLERLALNFKMQLENQEGIVNLKGHAGTGKDVLMKIFANRTRRPMFSFDCSRWTTEVELSEDLQLEAENGATRSIKVPSTVLIAAQTPGAILYFNEFNAMPEEAQLFLHALFDEKRSITLKTRSGKTVKADASVLLACSMNPNYPGTFKPQMATRSRFIDLEVDYPPLHREIPATDTNKNSAYSASEALKIAKSVGSLKKLTREQNMDKNEFIQMWESYVNKVGNPVQMTTTQKFDLDAIIALVQFTNKIRENFILKFEKGRPVGGAQPLPVEQPITLREMRRCAWKLSQIPDAEKTTLNAEQVARDLIEEYYLSHFDKMADKEAVKTAMKTWTSSKRLV